MNKPGPERQIIRQNLRRSPYFGSVGGLLAVILGFWTPLYLPYLILAAMVGSIAFFIAWFGLRRHRYLGPVCTIVTIFPMIIGRELLLPRDIPHWISFRCILQAAGVWMFVMAALHLAFREKLRRDLDTDAASQR
jgi:hypothetical protein